MHKLNSKQSVTSVTRRKMWVLPSREGECRGDASMSLEQTHVLERFWVSVGGAGALVGHELNPKNYAGQLAVDTGST
jgi:hypothetical protein